MWLKCLPEHAHLTLGQEAELWKLSSNSQAASPSNVRKLVGTHPEAPTASPGDSGDSEEPASYFLD